MLLRLSWCLTKTKSKDLKAEELYLLLPSPLPWWNIKILKWPQQIFVRARSVKQIQLLFEKQCLQYRLQLIELAQWNGTLKGWAVGWDGSLDASVGFGEREVNQPCFVLRNLQFKQEEKFSFITNFKVVSSSLIDWLIDSAFCSQRKKKVQEVACLINKRLYYGTHLNSLWLFIIWQLVSKCLFSYFICLHF